MARLGSALNRWRPNPAVVKKHGGQTDHLTSMRRAQVSRGLDYYNTYDRLFLQAPPPHF